MNKESKVKIDEIIKTSDGASFEITSIELVDLNGLNPWVEIGFNWISPEGKKGKQKSSFDSFVKTQLRNK